MAGSEPDRAAGGAERAEVELSLADRVVVMYEGEVTGEFDPELANVEEIGLAMAGGER